jgi:hypothetical protein
MPSFETEVEISVCDFLSECKERDINKLVDILISEGYIKPDKITNTNTNLNTFNDIQWQNVCDKLANNRHQMSVDEESMIKSIADRFF